MCGSFRRVLVMLITGTEMRLPVPGPRFDCLMSGRPGSSSFCSEPAAVGQADLRELARDHAAAALEHAEDVGRGSSSPTPAADTACGRMPFSVMNGVDAAPD